MNHKLLPAFLLLTLSLFFAQPCLAIFSMRLTDNIQSNGRGNIDLYSPASPQSVINGSVLEQFRLDNEGQLVFAVDVNEAANGTEKSSSQGVAIKTALLRFNINGAEYVFDNFSTRSKSLLAEKGSTSRTIYSTLIGDSGSNRITNSNDSEINGSSFDATIRFPVNMDISNATSAFLEVTFLDTNIALGDPEAFYDYSNGFEDVAIISQTDAIYLDDLAAGQDEAPLVLPEDTSSSDTGATVYYPSQTTFYIAAYEDFYPLRGDYDFNDLVVAYRVNIKLNQQGDITEIFGEGYLIARGAGFNHDWHLRIPLPESIDGQGLLYLFNPGSLIPTETTELSAIGDLDIRPFTSTRRLWTDDPYEMVNTLSEQSLIQGHRFRFEYTLSSPILMSQFTDMPFDPYLYVYDTQYEIHLPGKEPVLGYSKNMQQGHTDFIDVNNYPYAQVFNNDWKIPLERIDLGDAYPDYVNYISSGKATHQTWYQTPNNDKIKSITQEFWAW